MEDAACSTVDLAEQPMVRHPCIAGASVQIVSAAIPPLYAHYYAEPP